MKKLNTISKTIALTGVVSALSLISTTTSSEAGSNLEQEFLSIVDNKNSSDIVIENGVMLTKGETLDLVVDEGWELSNNEGIVMIDSEGILHSLKEGTVYISNEISDKLHIIEVYVSDDEAPLMLAHTRSSGSVNRNYYKVFIDAGHGGSDPGAVGYGNEEADINLQVAKRVETKLKAKGIEVKMSRNSDVFYSLSERAKMANNYGADAFVSIHQNAASSPIAQGIETYYHTNKSSHKPLSVAIQDKAIAKTGAISRGVKNAKLGVLGASTMPSTLFEGGFITNEAESTKLATPSYQDKLASAIADGVEAYLKSTLKLSGSNSGSSSNTVETVIKRGVVNSSSPLNVRSGASTSYSKIGSLSKGSNVDIVSESNGWYKIKYGSGYGFVSSSYITLNSTSNVESVLYKGVTNTYDLNVRSGPGTSYDTNGVIKKGSSVEVLAIEGEWSKIKYNTSFGYIYTKYITKEGESTTPNTNVGGSNNTTNNTTSNIKKGIVIDTNSLNVRSGYGTSNSKIGTLSKNATVEIVETKDGWHKIKYGNSYGYVSGSYIKIITSTTDTSINDSFSNNSNNSNATVINKGVVTSNSALNVRSGAGTNFSKLGSLSKGTTVEIISTNNGWHKIKYGNSYGYVNGGYIRIITSSSNVSDSNTIKKGTVYNASSGLNVRKGASTSYASLGKISNGTTVEVVSTSNGWHKIKYNNSYGYVSASYIKL